MQEPTLNLALSLLIVKVGQHWRWLRMSARFGSTPPDLQGSLKEYGMLMAA